MCGIAGYIGSAQIPQERLQSCLKRMQQRGPDAQGMYAHQLTPEHQVYLLHSRLNIIDLDARSNQPFRIGTQMMVFNGELYNYLEIKQQLQANFHTESDTEVLLQGIVLHGWKILDQCEGMWAFAIYNEQDGSLLLSRDRFGEKPLYLYRDQTGLYFGSEIKFIVALLGHALAINYQHLYRYMVNGYKALNKGSDTFFQGIEELRAGHILQIEHHGQESRHPYWQPHYQVDDAMSYQEAVQQTREALIEAVRLRLRADVPLAFCMSGGVDSNSLIAIARRVFDYDVHGFTIVNTDARYEEQDMVEHAIQQLGIRHHAMPVSTQHFLPRLRDLITYHDAPVYTITYYAHWLLMESIAQAGYRISVSGTAADELFSGYYDHHLAYLYEIRNEPKRHAQALQAWKQHVQPIVRNPYLSNPDLFFESQDIRDYIFLNADIFSGYLKSSWFEPFEEKYLTDDLLRNRMLNELLLETVPVILHEDDLNAMYFSIENRSPFLDRHLFELAYRIPTRHLIQEGMAKAVLRDAMRGIVPSQILDSRRKVGFNAPIFSFLDVHDPEVRAFLLDDSPIFEHVHRDKIKELIAKEDLPNSESKFLFYFLNSKIFLEEFAQ